MGRPVETVRATGAAVADDRLLARRARWLEMRLGVLAVADPAACPTVAEADAALARARRTAPRTTSDPAKRLAAMEAAYAEVFGEESLERWLRSHDHAMQRQEAGWR